MKELIEAQQRHERDVRVLAEMQREFKPSEDPNAQWGKVVEAMVARVNRQVAASDAAVRERELETE